MVFALETVQYVRSGFRLAAVPAFDDFSPNGLEHGVTPLALSVREADAEPFDVRASG